MAGAMEWVLALQQADAAKETSSEGKKRAQRRYADAVLALSKAFALGAASDRGGRDPRRGRLLPGHPGGAGQEHGRGTEERRRAGAGDPTDCEPGRGFDRNHRHHEGRGHQHAQIFPSFRTTSWRRCATIRQRTWLSRRSGSSSTARYGHNRRATSPSRGRSASGWRRRSPATIPMRSRLCRCSNS